MNDIQSMLISAISRLVNSSDSANLDAEILLSYVLKKPRSHLRAWPEKVISIEQQTEFIQLVDQRQKGMPIAYITGNREFWSREFKVSSDVLIPRPDTELLIELSLKQLEVKQKSRVIDLGTGSGNIAITLAAERPDCSVLATDFSHKALKVAKENAIKHQIKNIHFIQSFWLNAISCTKFDLIISNPPYVRKDDQHLLIGDLRFEPKNALIASDQGLSDIKTIAKQSRLYLITGGCLMIEHGFDQQQEVQDIFNFLEYSKICTYTDLAGNPRVTSGLWNQK